MARKALSDMSFASIYPLYVKKAERKNRTKEEVDQLIFWLTGYDATSLAEVLQNESDLTTFFEQAPGWNLNAEKITGIVCGIRVEDIEDPLLQKIRYLDKIIDELAKGKALPKIMRN